MASKTFKTLIRLLSLSSDPVSFSDGDMFFNSTTKRMKLSSNSALVSLATTADIASGSIRSDVSQRYYTNAVIPSASTTIVITAGQTVYIPVLFTAPVTIDQIGLNVTSAGAGGTCYISRYAMSSSTARPGALVVTYGNLTVASTGARTLSVSETIPAGWHWFGLLSLVQNTTISAVPTAAQQSGTGTGSIGSTGQVSFETQTATATPPNPAVPTSASFAAICPQIFWRVA